MHGCSLPASKTSNFPVERSRISKKNRLRRYKTPLAALAGMLYLYKYFRFFDEMAEKKIVACGAQKLSEFSNRNFFKKKLRLADPIRK